jgi:hypothetical protein
LVQPAETAPETEEASAGEKEYDTEISRPDDATSTAGEALIEGADFAVDALGDDTASQEGGEAEDAAGAKGRTVPGTPRAETPGEAQSAAIVDSGNAEQE